MNCFKHLGGSDVGKYFFYPYSNSGATPTHGSEFEGHGPP